MSKYLEVEVNSALIGALHYYAIIVLSYQIKKCTSNDDVSQ